MAVDIRITLRLLRYPPKKMKTTEPKIRCLLIIIVGAVFLSACTSSHIIVGKTRPPSRPEDIKVYLDPPKKYEQIALVDADSNASFKFSAQGKVNAALERMKQEAAKLGANGILLRGRWRERWRDRRKRVWQRLWEYLQRHRSWSFRRRSDQECVWVSNLGHR